MLLRDNFLLLLLVICYFVLPPVAVVVVVFISAHTRSVTHKLEMVVVQVRGPTWQS